MERIYHTWDKWECYPAGLYEPRPAFDIEPKDAEKMYADFLTDDMKFSEALNRIITEWKNSCEHYLSNENMNRIAWLGQASACLSLGLPRKYRSGFYKMSEDEQKRANETALKYLNIWLERRGEKPLSMDEAQSKTEMDLY